MTVTVEHPLPPHPSPAHNLRKTCSCKKDATSSSEQILVPVIIHTIES